jgi:hypothetical protein
MILNRDGVEVSRQEKCVLESPLWDKEGSMCPIVADNTTFVAGRGKTKDIVATGLFDDATGRKTYRYRLVNGHYQ